MNQSDETRSVFWPDCDGTIWTGEVPADAPDLGIGWDCPNCSGRVVCLIDFVDGEFRCCPRGQVHGNETAHRIPERWLDFVGPAPPMVPHARALVHGSGGLVEIPLEAVPAVYARPEAAQ